MFACNYLVHSAFLSCACGELAVTLSVSFVWRLPESQDILYMIARHIVAYYVIWDIGRFLPLQPLGMHHKIGFTLNSSEET